MFYLIVWCEDSSSGGKRMSAKSDPCGVPRRCSTAAIRGCAGRSRPPWCRKSDLAEALTRQSSRTVARPARRPGCGVSRATVATPHYPPARHGQSRGAA